MERYRVTIEEEPSGCGPAAVIVFLIVIAMIVESCTGFFSGYSSPNNSTNSGYQQSVSQGEGTKKETSANTTLPEDNEKLLAELYVYDDHSDVLDNISRKGSVTDSYGNKYDAPYIDLCSYGAHGSYDAVRAYTDFVTDGKYMYLEGTYFCRAEQSEDFTITFQIYADGKLIYDSGEISRQTKAIHFKVTIDNADIVRVMSFSDDYTMMRTNPGVILVNAIVYN